MPPALIERDRPDRAAVFGKRLAGPSEDRARLRQADDGEIGSLFQSFVEEIPGGQAILRAGLEQADGQVSQRLGRADQQCPGRDHPGFAARTRRPARRD